MRKALLSLLLLTTSTSVGCAGMINGDFQKVLITSEPPGAAIYRGTQPLGITPARVEFQRGDARIELRLQKEGYQAYAIHVKRGLSGWLWLNFLAFGETALQAWLAGLIRLSIDLVGDGKYALRAPTTAIMSPLSQPDANQVQTPERGSPSQFHMPVDGWLYIRPEGR